MRPFEWVTSATPHAAGTSGGIIVLGIGFWVVGEVRTVLWGKQERRGVEG